MALWKWHLLTQYSHLFFSVCFLKQLNYYGFVHVRSFSTTGSTTTALWVNRDLAKQGSAEISSVLMLKRVEPCESAKTAEGRRVRKEMAIFTVEEDIGVSPKSLQMEQIQSLATRAGGVESILKDISLMPRPVNDSDYAAPPVPTEVHCHHMAAPPAFPSLSSSRRVSSTGSSRLPSSPTDHYLSSASNSHCPSQDQSGDPGDNIDAANLLLMLSSSGGRSTNSGDYSSDSPSTISPGGHFLM